MAAAGRARARPAGPRAGVRCRIPSAGPRPGPLEAPGERDAAATTRGTRPLPGVAPGVLGQPARDAGLRRRATRLPGDRRRAGEATALVRVTSGCQPRAEPTMERPRSMHGQPRRQQRKPAPASVRLPRPREQVGGRRASAKALGVDPGACGPAGPGAAVAWRSCPAVRPRLRGLPPDTPPVYAARCRFRDQSAGARMFWCGPGRFGSAGWRGGGVNSSRHHS